MPSAPDVAFYRILCITLVAVAVTFSVILTSIFIDIDGLLSRQSSRAINKEPTTAFRPVSFKEYQEFPSSEDSDDEMEPSFRNKRSLETNNLMYKIKSPKLKKILTNHIATLLEELDEDKSLHATKTNELPVNNNRDGPIKSNDISGEENVPKTEDNKNVQDNNDNFKGEQFLRDFKQSDENADTLHLAMHNILLNGIVGHIDLSEVYEKVHLLIKKFDGTKGRSFTELDKGKNIKDKSTEFMKGLSRKSYDEENKFFEELLKCQKVQKQISQRKHLTDDAPKKDKDSPILIKAVIEVTDNEKIKENTTNPNKHVKGLIKMLYNGRPAKVEEMVDDKYYETTNKIENSDKTMSIENLKSDISPLQSLKENNETRDFNHAINEYLRTHSIQLQNSHGHNLIAKESFKSKRLKRQIKISYGNDKDTREKYKKLNKNHKNHNDELYVEIETHFDGRGAKGEKKKKLVRSLIDKIQQAINSNLQDAEKNSTDKPIQIKKRTQNPIDTKELAINNLKGITTVDRRLLNPISKTSNMIQPLKSVLDKYGEEWRKKYKGPGFLTEAKSLNSAEMSELDIDYNIVMDNGIPKRLQLPLNTENDQMVKANEGSNNKNVTLYLKEIDGSGFTVGFNQYADDPPDEESLKMFTGLENLIKAYHERYDQEDIENSEKTDYTEDNYHDDIQEYTSRRKRSPLKVKLFTNLKSKTTHNKFLNTRAMQTKKIFLKSKRNKRHIDKIRIVASDHYPRTENENIFLVSHEDIFADRAIIKERELPEVEIGDRDDEHYDYIAPYESNIPHQQPYVSRAYDTRTLQTNLMSHYPHIFIDNISESKEEYVNIKSSNHQIFKNGFRKLDSEGIIDTTAGNEKNMSLPSVEEIVNAILPQANYKLTVKILPKNNSEMNPRYKEVHTTINKSYDKNGLRYVSSVNVSEISKFEHFNKSKEEISSNQNTQKGSVVNEEIEKQRNQMKLLLRLHKTGIDRQLEHLKMESQKIEGIIGNDDKVNMLKNISQIIDVFRQLGLIYLNTTGIVNSIEYRSSINETLTPNPSSTISATTIQPLVTEKNQDDVINAELIKTIKQNVNNTRLILEKIDNNTNVLQSFLQKLIDKLQPTQVNMQEESVLRNSERITPRHSEAIIPSIDEFNKNYSKPIPFIYAFQHPITQNRDKTLKSVANVIYHGHIHANEADKFGKRGDFFKDIASNIKFKNTESEKGNNETRFFIDDLDNDIKLTPNVVSNPTDDRRNLTKPN